MRVLYITGSMPPMKCGIGFYSSRLLRYLETKAKITVLTTAGLDKEAERYKTIYTISWGILHLRRLIGQISSANPDLISLQYPAKGYKRQLGINILPYLVRKVPIILTLHEYHGSGFLGKTRNFITALPVKKIIVSNDYDREALPFFLRKKTVVIPIGSNIQKQQSNRSGFEELIKKTPLSSKKPIGVFFGFSFPNKGLELLLDATEKSDTQLLLLTELEDKNSYQRKIKERISSLVSRGYRIYHAGHLDDKAVSIYLQECDYFILPQPLPLTAKSGTAIAASLHGVPVISTGADIKDINLPYVHNVNSILLNPMNTQTLSRTLSDLSSNKDLLAELRTKAKALGSYFDWDSIASRHHSLWKEVLNEK